MPVSNLFNIDGALLSSFSQNQPFKIGNMSFEAHFQSDGIMRLCTYKTTDNRSATYKRIVDNMKNELLKRKQDLLVIENDLEKITLKIQEGSESVDELGLEMARMLMLKGQHKKRIGQLKNQTKISVAYQKVHKSHFVMLTQGVFTQLPWLKKPVMWCTELEEKVEVKTTDTTEEMTITSLEERDITKGHLYAIGGWNGSSYHSSVERYDPDQNKWTTIAMMRSKRSGPGVATANGKLYAIGGYDGSSYFSSAERYDPLMNKWIPIAEMNSKRAWPGTAVLNGELYVVGGYNGSSLSTVERYNPEQNKWTFSAPMNSKRFQPGLAVIEGNLYAVGGSDGTALSSLERYDPDRNKWTIVSSMSCKRRNPGVAVVGGHVYAIGGYDGSCSLSSVERYDPIENRWTPVAAMNSERSYLAAAAMGGKLYAVGGSDDFYQLSSVEQYDAENNKWTTVAAMTFKRSCPGVAVIPL